MKLILQAIKALFRKFEKLIQSVTSQLSIRVDRAQETADKAKEAADRANAAADEAKEASKTNSDLSSNSLTGVLPIEKGGTGASSVEAALAALGIAFGYCDNKSNLFLTTKYPSPKAQVLFVTVKNKITNSEHVKMEINYGGTIYLYEPLIGESVGAKNPLKSIEAGFHLFARVPDPVDTNHGQSWFMIY